MFCACRVYDCHCHAGSPLDVFLSDLEGTRQVDDGAQGCQMEDGPENRDNSLQEGGFVLYFLR
jgi:hypothetical protein